MRAIAVMAVILNHTGTRWAAGGFLGVDLFFVISGYLITGILAADLREGRFSIARFYERRIRRIIPALMLVMLLCTPFAWWLMLPDGLENFGQSLVGTTLFANNIVLMLTSGYFELASQFKPLMHTWSLGVEEQYYLLAPALMWLAWRWGKARGLVIGILAIIVVSFATTLILHRFAPRLDFFLIFSRGWELGAGALAVLVEPRIRLRAGPRLAAMLAAGGLIAAMTPLFLTGGGSLFSAVLVAGTCLILLFGGTRDPAGRILSSPPFVAIGMISYSAYLFHQPIFSFVRIISFDPLRPGTLVIFIVPILLCAWASWRFVERPFRDPNRISTRTLLIASAGTSLLVLAIGFTFHFTSGFYRNWPELDGAGGPNANIAYNYGPDRFTHLRLPSAADKPRVLVIGNSFARDFINMATETAGADAFAVAFEPLADCKPLPDGVAAQAKRADFIILASRFHADQVPCIANHIADLKRLSSVPIIIIGRKSFGYNMNPVMRLPKFARATWRNQPLPDAVAANDGAKRAFPDAVYIDLLGMLSDPQGRVPVFTPQLQLISQDGDHLTRAGARYLGPILFRHPALAPMLAAAQAHPR